MDWLNYHHLQYFWHAVREGGVSAASRKLSVAQPTVSAQLRSLERQAGGKLYEVRGRRLEPTDLGRTVFDYADTIFRTGEELIGVLNGRGPSGRRRLSVGVPDVLPKLVAFRLLGPAFARPDEFKPVVREGPLKSLLRRLARRELDVVFSDAPPGGLDDSNAEARKLGESAVGLFGTTALVRKYGRDLPASFAGAPLLVPREGTTLRRSLDGWLASLPSPARVVGEFDDTALMKVFAEAGTGFAAAPAVVTDDLRKRFRLHPLCELPDVREEFYAVTTPRRGPHPAAELLEALAAGDFLSGGPEEP